MAFMPDESRTDDVEKLLAEEQAVEGRKKALISALLKQREAALKEFDEKLAKLGYQAEKPRRSHHKKAASVGAPAAKTKS